MIKASLLACAIMLGSLNLFAQISDFNDADFRKADSIAGLYPHHTLIDLKILSEKLTAPLEKDEEKFRAIYKWVCDNIVNDYSLFSEHKKQRERLDAKSFEIWNRKFSAKAFRILVSEHRTICTGYARLVSELATDAGLECRVVDGYGRSGQSNNGGKGVVNHSWNAVRLYNKWYLCDPTWSSGVIDGASLQFVRKFNELYFLPPPDMFVQNHYPVDTAFVLSNNIKSLDSYLNAPLISVEAYRYELLPISPQSFKVIARKSSSVSFQFKSPEWIEPKKLELLVGKTVTDDRFELRREENDHTLVTVDHSFKSRGIYRVHMMIESKPVISYEVTVK
jgi:hypothetical protein